ncbi:MAG: hypothetical protein ACKO3P_06185 [Planctomycetaceae bacterium]
MKRVADGDDSALPALRKGLAEKPELRQLVPEEWLLRIDAPRSTPSLREQYLGRTRGKGSRTGRQVIERMVTEGNLRWNSSGGAEVRYVDPVTKAESWLPLNSTEMGHLHDAVKYWNETGRTLGPKHPDVQK